jgi:multiple sugar transport system permease protein
MSIQARRRTSQAIIIIVMLIICVVFILPYVWMLLNSFKPQAEIMKGKTFLPAKFTWGNYVTVWTKAPILAWFRNSVVTTACGTVILLFTSTIAGFVFGKYQFKGKNALFWFILATMMVPVQTTMIPSFLLVEKLGLYDKLAALVIPRMVGGFGIFL